MNKLVSLAILGAVALEGGVSAKKHSKDKSKHHTDKYKKDIIDTRIATHGFAAFYTGYVSKVLGSDEIGDCMGASSRQSLQDLVHAVEY